MQVKSNQYGFPCSTYWYIVDNAGNIYHKDGKWRKKSLIELWSYGFKTEQEAVDILNTLTK